VGYRIRISQSGSGSKQAKLVLKKREKMKKYHVGSVVFWAGVFSWSLDVLHGGLSCNRRSLQFSTENRRNMKFFTFLFFSFFVAHL
jgi:hypothetical protein